MTDHDEAVMEVWIFFALIFFTILAAYWFYIRFLRDGDVVAEAKEATAQADQLIAQRASIDSFVTAFLERRPHSVHIAEAMYLAKQRNRTKKGRRR